MKLRLLDGELTMAIWTVRMTKKMGRNEVGARFQQPLKSSAQHLACKSPSEKKTSGCHGERAKKRDYTEFF
ncbi:unnamed protein product [Protopolystoma xenopodis]|uniref:Uncharacterized protein n=1 Tax=Protopolystoma xenopodis TaxID=117903 RepID=A0A448X479_9PLAT|nr:unnamed protein product [Protopolystoma xenopodis]